MTSIEHTANLYRTLRMNAVSKALEGLVANAEDNQLSYLQFAEQLAEHECAARQRKRIALHRKQAQIPVPKSLDEFDYRHQTSITKRQVNQLLDFGFIDNRANLIFIGPPGVGKTHLAIGIGQKAIDAGYKVLFTSALGMVETLELAEMRGELKKKIAAIAKFDLVILDELGYLPMTKSARFNLFQLVNSLYEYRSVILTTNKDFTAWADFFHDDNVAVPIVDRLIHHSQIFMLAGESYRLKSKQTNR